jgi:hypothetical protein
MNASLLHLETLLDSIICIGTQYLDTSGDGMPCEIFAVPEFKLTIRGVRFELTWERPGVCVTQSVFCPSKRVEEDRRKIGDIINLPNFKQTFSLFTHGVVNAKNIDGWDFSYETKQSNYSGIEPVSTNLSFFVLSNEQYFLGDSLTNQPCAIEFMRKGSTTDLNGSVFRLKWRRKSTIVVQTVFYPCSECTEVRLKQLFQQPNFKHVFALFTDGEVDAPQNWEMTPEIADPIVGERDPGTNDLVFKVLLH